jgi:CRP-like cAMP-binding protein
MLVVLSGAIEVVLPGIAGETLVTVHTAGDFLGEMSAIPTSRRCSSASTLRSRHRSRSR